MKNEVIVNSNTMKNKRKSFLITHKKDLMSLCNAIGGAKGEIFSYLINNLVFTDNTVKVTYKKITKDTGISYATVSKSMKEFEDNGLIKRKNGYLMVVPTLIMRGDYQSENRLLREFKEFNEDIDSEYTKKIKSIPMIDDKADILILTSDPTKGRSKTSENYYSKPTDEFWNIIFDVLNVDDPINYGDRLYILKENRIALWDVMHITQTVDNYKIKKHKEYNDFDNFFDKYKNIKLIACNGEETYKLIKKLISNRDLKHINIVKLPSSGPSRGKYFKSYEDKLNDWKIINQYIVNKPKSMKILSAKKIGEQLDLTASEVNKLLQKAGYLTGEPGKWIPTSLAEGLFKLKEKCNGYEGDAKRASSFLKWDERIVDELSKLHKNEYSKKLPID